MSVFEWQQVDALLKQLPISRKGLLEALQRFSTKRILLVGDLIIDVYTQCTAIGKTAKTPTLSVKRGASTRYWGGSSLIANNLLAMGGHVTFVAVTGDDWGHEYFSQRAHERLTSKFFKDRTRPTTVKERFWVDGYKLLQVDTVENHDIPAALEEEIASYLEASLSDNDMLMIADNRHGIMTQSLIDRVKALQRRARCPVVVDTQVSNRWGNLEQYADVSLLCINEHEARFFLRDERSPVEEILHRMVDVLRPERLFIKLKERGMIGWDTREGDFRFPALPVKVVDPIGAGDAFLGAAALAFDAETPLYTSIYLASCAGAIAVTKMGTDPVMFDELQAFAVEAMRE